MGALPRPDLPPGPQRDLVDALHSLHHRTGWPSLRRLAREAGCSHTTVSSVFSSRRLPSWAMLQLVVEAMGGDEGHFRPLWLAASAPDPGPVAPVALLAGRSTELTTVRRHLGQDAGGLLLVRGVAGIGKTRLVQAAVTSMTSTTVGWGACLPLATGVPLLPLVDMLRWVHEVDGGQWLQDALADCPPYVAWSLSRLLPELTPSPGTSRRHAADPEDEWSGHRMFAAVETMLSKLGSLRPFAVVLEDLHWADAATLDLVEHLLARCVAVPLVATWRSEDPAVPDATAEWCTRVRRLGAVRTLSLGPLTRAETAEQIAMVAPSRPGPGLVDAVYERSEGLPLFTEHLVVESDPAFQELPELLGELLDRRLAPLTESAWRVVRALGLAGRPLSEALLGEVTRLTPGDLASGLHELEARHLLRLARTGLVRLRHALLAEAVLLRLTRHEVADEHRRLASALAATPEPVAAEVAEHWQRGGDAAQELAWRIRAAHQADARFAFVPAAAQWRRALDLWPDGTDAVGSPEVRRVDAYLAAMDALFRTDVAAGREVAQGALGALGDLTGPDAAETYRAAALMVPPAEALLLAERAVAIYEQLPPCGGYVEALGTQSYLLDKAGRCREATALATRATEVSEHVGDPALYKTRLAVQALLELDARPDVALSLIETAASIEPPEPDLRGAVYVATLHTDTLLITNASPDEVAAAARPVLQAVTGEELDTWPLSVTRANVAMAYRRAGQVGRASELIDPRTEGPVSFVRWAEHSMRAILDALRGRPESAARRFEELSAVPYDTGLYNLIEFTEDQVDAELWSGHPRAAYDRALDLLYTCAPTDASAHVAGLLVLAARAAADLVFSNASCDEHTTGEQLLGTVLDLGEAGLHDPFKPLPSQPVRPALATAWTAETLRLAGRATVNVWVAAAREWDRLTRPHDAAYCRWQAAQVALGAGQGTAARTLLQRARRDAREHVPLLAAVAATATEHAAVAARVRQSTEPSSAQAGCAARDPRRP